MLARRWFVLGAWAALVVLGALSAARLPGLLSTSLAVPGTGSAQADSVLTAHFHENIEGTFSVVFRVAHPSRAETNSLETHLREAARVLPSARATPLEAGAGILYGAVTTTLDLQHAAALTNRFRAALDAGGFAPASVTGAPALQHDITPILAADLRRGELIAVLGALALLLAVLGVSSAVAIPLVVAACTTAATLLVLFGLAHVVLMVLYVPNLVELIGLGLAVDYSLLIVHRFREELSPEGTAVDDAVVATAATAGRAVLVSGVAVVIGLAVLLLIPVPFVRSLGLAGILVPLVSMLAALTLQPALLSVLGRGAVRSTRRSSTRARRSAENGLWPRLARLVLARPAAVTFASLLVLGLAAAPVAALRLTPGSLTAVPQGIASDSGLDLLATGVGPGIITPDEIVLDAGAPGAADSPANSEATLRLAESLLHEPEVFVVAIGSRPPYTDASRRFRRLLVFGRHEFGSPQAQALVHEIRSRLVPAARFPAADRVVLGGAPAQGTDFLDRVYGTFPFIVVLVLGLAYLVLVRAFRSVLLPLMAIALDALSVAATYGLLVLVFRDGVGAHLLGLYRVPQIEGWVPVFLFAMLFGLSMDYEVFFVTRMRESYDAGNDGRGAITEGLVHTGRVVSAAAVIMVAALSGLVAGRVAGLQELGTGLALGVLLDATIVRGLLMPSLMAHAGRWNWWLPGWLARVARVDASPLATRAGRGLSDATEAALTSPR